MGGKNQTDVSHFFLLGLTDDPTVKPVIFCIFLLMYMVTILGNLLIILAVCSYSHLQTPMYFFISNLSIIDLFFFPFSTLITIFHFSVISFLVLAKIDTWPHSQYIPQFPHRLAV